MKRMILAAVAAFGLMSVAAADHGGPVQGQVVGGGCAGCAAGAAPTTRSWAAPAAKECGCSECEKERKLGLNPLFKRLMFWKKDNECGTCGIKNRLAGCLKCGPFGGGHPGYGGFDPYPNGVPGTLVFPQHPYVRSPRDWYEK